MNPCHFYEVVTNNKTSLFESVLFFELFVWKNQISKRFVEVFELFNSFSAVYIQLHENAND